jgi:hypothetical protein
MSWLDHPSTIYHVFFGAGAEWQPADPDTESRLLRSALKVLLVQRRAQALAVDNSNKLSEAKIAAQTSTDAQEEIKDRKNRLDRLDEEIAAKRKRLHYLAVYRARHLLVIGLFVILLLLYCLLGGAKAYRDKTAQDERIRIASLQ